MLLEVNGLTKRFGSLVANDEITFSVRAGEVHGLLGENGAGKSTLVKSLYGIHQADAGRLVLGGTELTVSSPAHARDLGLGMVFQDMRLIPGLTVWENIALHLRQTSWVLAPKRLKAEIARAAEEYGLAVDPTARVWNLSVGEWQRVELLKVLMAGARVLILDEPTSVLTPPEADALFAVLRRLTGAGVGVILITHKVREIREIVDRVTVLRAGRTVLADADPRQLSDDELVRAMVGVSLKAVTAQDMSAAAPDASPVLQLEHVSVTRADGSLGLDDVCLAVSPGEILGVAGIAGHGQSELADVLVGMSPLQGGSIRLRSQELGGAKPVEFRRAGVLDIVSHPAQQFVVNTMTISEHAALWESARAKKGKRFDVREAFRRFGEREREAQLHTAHPSRRLDKLSGGNIQRVMVTLALTSSPAVLVAAYPTRGLDVLTTARTHELLIAARAQGTPIVLISEDLDELLALSDRVAVLSRGRIADIVAAGTATRDQLGTLMTRGEAHEQASASQSS